MSWRLYSPTSARSLQRLNSLPASKDTHNTFSRVAIFLLFFAMFFIAGCAYKTGAIGTKDLNNDLFSGRISLQTESDPPQAFFAGFEIKGKADRGELTLTSPLGTVLGVMRWSQSEAVLDSGSNIRRFDSVDALLEETTGAALPLSALFDWLHGKNTVHRGWAADLSRHAEGRIDAVRTEPTPRTTLRLVLEQDQ